MNTAAAFIPLAEAIKVTGVSESTLRRFADAGYMHAQQNDEGISFQKEELFALFKITNKPLAERIVADTAPSAPAASHHEDDEEKVEVEDAEVESGATMHAASHQEDAPVYTARSACLDALEQEVAKLKALAELHEKYITFKESEIKSLTQERDWLRTRIEKLEDKAERDQMIMASMSETQRSLLTQLDKRKSTLQLALEWVGLTPPQDDAAKK